VCSQSVSADWKVGSMAPWLLACEYWDQLMAWNWVGVEVWLFMVLRFSGWFVKQRYNAPTYFASPNVKIIFHPPFYCDFHTFVQT